MASDAGRRGEPGDLHRGCRRFEPGRAHVDNRIKAAVEDLASTVNASR